MAQNEKRQARLQELRQRQARLQELRAQQASKVEAAPKLTLREEVTKLAAENPTARPYLVPILRRTALDGDELLGGRTWGNPDPHSTPDDKVPYHKHEDSPPAGADGSPQRKRYNEWFRENVCPTHKTNCGAPWLAKSAAHLPGSWVEKQNPHRWIWLDRGNNLAFTVYEKPGPGIPIYTLAVLMPDGNIYTHIRPFQWKDPQGAMEAAANWYKPLVGDGFIGVDMTHNWQRAR